MYVRMQAANPPSPVRAARSARTCEQQKLWRRENPEAAKAVDAAERSKRDPAKRSAIMRSWRERNRESRRAYDNAYKAAWRAANPDLANMKGRLARARRRAREEGAEGSFTAADIKRLFAEQNGLCVGLRVRRYRIKFGLRDRSQDLACSRGGSQYPDNLQLLCVSCNRRKHSSTMDEWPPMPHRRFSPPSAVEDIGADVCVTTQSILLNP